MDATEVVVHVVEGHRRRVVLQLLENAFVNLVNRRIDIRIVRFWRSTYYVLTCFGLGLPVMTSVVILTIFAGL